MVALAAELVTGNHLSWVRCRRGDPSADARPFRVRRARKAFLSGDVRSPERPSRAAGRRRRLASTCQQSTVLVLAAAAAAQLGDVAIGVVHRIPGMVVFPLAVAVLHLAGAAYLM